MYEFRYLWPSKLDNVAREGRNGEWKMGPRWIYIHTIERGKVGILDCGREGNLE